jgi:hypothetical protein
MIMNSTNSKRVLFLFTTPSGSHLNPTLSYANQLLTKLDEMNIEKIVIFSEPPFYERILNIPNNTKNQIEVRSYNLEKFIGHTNLLKVYMDFNTTAGSLMRCFRCFENSFKAAANQLAASLANTIHEEQPVLIIYDHALMFMSLVFMIYQKTFKCAKPVSIMFVTTFMFRKSKSLLYYV